MPLYLIGLGLNDVKDISVKGLECARKCSHVYFENYTGKFASGKDEIEEFIGKKIICADRNLVENKADDTILKDAIKDDVAFLVIGDPMSATTHADLMMRARQKNIDVKVIHGASIFTAVAATGLQLYKFGKTASVPFPRDNFNPIAYYDVLKQNLDAGFHTLLLLDVDAENHKFMTINEAIQLLLDAEKKKEHKIFSAETLCIGCARMGSDNQCIKAGKASQLLNFNFRETPHCLIIPAKLHFMEEEALEMWR